jgi:hypothetical protein
MENTEIKNFMKNSSVTPDVLSVDCFNLHVARKREPRPCSGEKVAYKAAFETALLELEEGEFVRSRPEGKTMEPPSAGSALLRT